jgi:hypothetical protein
MTRAKEVKAIIEGFKLGKLGANKKSPRDSDEEPRIRDWGPIFHDPDDEEMVVAHEWKEANDYNFLLVCRGTGLFGYDVLIYGGRYFKRPSGEISNKNLPKNESFSLRLLFSASDHQEARDRVDEIIREIIVAKSLGKALATGKLHFGWGYMERESGFEDYMTALGEDMTSKYFEKDWF